MEVPKSHPRYLSLMIREKIIEGWREGIVADAGLLAHGRGEAFDYLIGEKTQPFAILAMKYALQKMIKARNAVISVNGNVCALCAREIVELASQTKAKIEINLFYRTEERVQKIAERLRSAGAREILGVNPDARIPGLEHARGLCSQEGMYTADLVFVPLEDGDRVEALKRMGKFVVALDLNPLSRTARSADVTIVDNVARAIPKMLDLLKDGWDEVKEYDNREVLQRAMETIWNVLSTSTW